ncbi:YhfC family intramembrane metalloprotease [Streptococcus pneumoniae]|nr:YhfC family intramembrane metalloprotease [Streptococcus pneumoniae]
MTIHIIITMLLLLAFLIGSIWFAKKKYQINLAVLDLGAVAFFVSSQILEKLVHIPSCKFIRLSILSMA